MTPLYKKGQFVKVPCRNYEGWTYAKVKAVNAKGLVAVVSLAGTPWSVYSHGGWVQTNQQTFYSDVVDTDLSEEDLAFIVGKEKGYTLSKQLHERMVVLERQLEAYRWREGHPEHREQVVIRVRFPDGPTSYFEEYHLACWVDDSWKSLVCGDYEPFDPDGVVMDWKDF